MEATASEGQEDLMTNSCQVILLRHAKSVSNCKRQAIKAVKGFDKSTIIKVRVDKELRDSPLSEIGIEQCEKVQDSFNNIKVHTVLVSPLRRALQTAYHVFKSHPNFNKIKFVVVPKMREIINTTQSFPANIDTSIEELSQLIPNLDTSELDKYSDRLNYYVEDFDEELKDYINSNLEYNEEDCNKSNAFDLLYERLSKYWPCD